MKNVYLHLLHLQFLIFEQRSTNQRKLEIFAWGRALPSCRQNFSLCQDVAYPKSTLEIYIFEVFEALSHKFEALLHSREFISVGFSCIAHVGVLYSMSKYRISSWSDLHETRHWRRYSDRRSSYVHRFLTVITKGPQELPIHWSDLKKYA